MFLSNGAPIPPQTGTLGDVTPIFADASYYGHSALALGNAFAAYGQIYSSQLWVGIVVRKKAMATARMPFQVLQADGTPVDGPLAELLAKPNDRMSGFKLWQWTSSTRDVYGEAFWLKSRDKSGRVMELNPLHPRNVVVRRLPDGGTEYVYTSGARNVSMLPPIPAEDIVAFTGYNPDNLVRGVSNLEGLRMTLLNEDAARRASASFWNRGARPSMILTHPDSLSTGAQERLAKKAASAMGGADNMGGVSVFEEGISAQVMQLSNEDMQYIDSRKLNREEVCAAFDISPLVVHILDHATFSNVTEQLRSQYRDTMAPWFAELEADVNHQLVPDFYPLGGVQTRFDMSDVLRGDFEARSTATIALRANGILTGNEARQIMGEQPVEDPLMDRVFANAAMQELGTVPGSQPAQPDNGGTQLVRAVTVTDRGSLVLGPGADQGGKNFIRSLMDELSQVKGNLPATRERLKAQHERAMRAYFTAQHEAVMTRLRTKAAGPAEPFDKTVWDANLKEILTSLSNVTAKAVGTATADDLGVDFDLSKLEAWLEINADIASQRINETTAKTLAQMFAFDVEDEAAAAVDHAFSDGGEIMSRVVDIAKERVTDVGEFASMDVASDSTATSKTWVVNSPNPRPAHAARNGETVGIDEEFAGSGMQRPGDWAGGPDEVAGCECTLEYGELPNADPQTFRDQFEAAMEGSPFDAFVNHYTLEQIKGMKNIVLTEGGKAGMLVHDHGDGRIEATALFNQSGNKEVGRRLMSDSVTKYGVNYAECFGPVLPKIYENVGFKTVDAFPFDPEQAPKNWNSAKFDSPDYHVMTVGGVPLSELKPGTKAVDVGDVFLTELEAARDAAFADQSPEWVAKYGDASFAAARALVGYDPMS